MASVALRIRDTAATALRAISGMAGRVYLDQVYPVTPAGSITLRTPREDVDDMGYADGEPFLSLGLVIEVRAGGAGAVAATQTVTALVAQVEAAILGNADLRQLGMLVEYVGTEPSFGAIETPVALAVVTFRVLYREDMAPGELPLAAPEISAVAAVVGRTALRLGCDTDRDCCIQCRAHKLGEALTLYSDFESIPVSDGHDVIVAGLIPSTTYRVEIRADALESPDLPWSLFTDGIAGPDWTTDALVEDPIDPVEP